LNMFDRGYMRTNDKIYKPLSQDGHDLMGASLELATQVIRVLRQGAGNEAERRAAARALIDCKFSVTAPKWTVGYKPPDLEQIAGPIFNDAHVIEFRRRLPMLAAA
jgi:hypothetical protein